MAAILFDDKGILSLFQREINKPFHSHREKKQKNREPIEINPNKTMIPSGKEGGCFRRPQS
jgi:hypothetical protein